MNFSVALFPSEFTSNNNSGARPEVNVGQNHCSRKTVSFETLSKFHIQIAL